MTAPVFPSPVFTAADFSLAAEPVPECDLVLKGGITSGVVYPYAILEVAGKYRLRSIGGASAGAIAAGFAAAAEFARRGGDPGGFVRLEACCAELPAILAGLFQPAPRFRPLFRAALAFTARSNRLGKALWALKERLAVGALIGAAVYGLLVWLVGLVAGSSAWTPTALPGLLLAMAVGAAGWLGVHVAGLLLRDLPAANFGLCSGLKAPGAEGPALTEWFHACIQDIAFGKTPHAPLTFADLAGDNADLAIDFRAMTTNLSMQRPEVIPRTNLDLHFRPQEWRALFPAPVMDYLEAVSTPNPDSPGYLRLPPGDKWPILVGIRMSLSFPVLIQAIPLHMPDIGAKARGELATGQAPPMVKLLFSDGGITSNFPIHFFDALLPRRPTFAFSLDELPEAGGQQERISMPQGAAEGVFLPVRAVVGLGGFAGAILASAKDWQDQMQSVLPGQRQRVVRIRLSKDEGGLNLGMPPETSAVLMDLGRTAGRTVRTTFDFDEHRWRRALVAYEQLEVLTGALREVWPAYGVWYAGYSPDARSYRQQFPQARRDEIGKRLGDLATASNVMAPPIKAKFPRPTGRLRTVPEL